VSTQIGYRLNLIIFSISS